MCAAQKQHKFSHRGTSNVFLSFLFLWTFGSALCCLLSESSRKNLPSLIIYTQPCVIPNFYMNTKGEMQKNFEKMILSFHKYFRCQWQKKKKKKSLSKSSYMAPNLTSSLVHFAGFFLFVCFFAIITDFLGSYTIIFFFS